MRRFDVQEHEQHTLDVKPAAVEREQRVLERGFLAVLHDGLDLGFVSGNGFFEGRQVMFRLDIIERRGVERLIRPRKVERIFHGSEF